MTTLFRRHVERWQNCTACSLCAGRQQVVLARGEIPCDVLFCGEAPGESEDCIGAPFIGPAGQLLDRIIERAGFNSQHIDLPNNHWRPLRWAFTNLVCCIPRAEDGGKATEPNDESIRACSVRLVEFVEIADPKLIVCVGKLAKDWLDPDWRHSIELHRKIPLVAITHPGAIVRANLAMQGLMTQRCEVVLRNAVEEL